MRTTGPARTVAGAGRSGDIRDLGSSRSGVPPMAGRTQGGPSMTPDDFKIHDARAFPIVRLFPESLPAGYSLLWEKEMDALLGQPTPFVILMGNTEVAVEAH